MTNTTSLSDIDCPHCSPFPWAFEYSPYTLRDGGELPAFEVFDDHGNKVFDTNEDSPPAQQEANARLAAAAPALWQALSECVRLLAHHEGEAAAAYAAGCAALDLCPLPQPTKGD